DPRHLPRRHVGTARPGGFPGPVKRSMRPVLGAWPSRRFSPMVYPPTRPRPLGRAVSSMGFKTLLACALLAGLGGFADQLIAAAPVLSAGAARADITPDREMPNWATSPLQPYRT